MDSIERYRREFAYDDWANRELLRALGATADPPASALRWLAHVTAAEHLWLARLTGGTSAVPVWPALDRAGIAALLEDLRAAWTRVLDGLDAPGLERTVHYVNTKGEPWTSRVEDVLGQVLFHGAHHRGQIASALRAAGIDPPALDFIHAVRTGRIE